jgi:hypothetical protein
MVTIRGRFGDRAVERGFEREVIKRMEWWDKKQREKKK